MCGIIGYIGDKKATPVLINGLLCLECRGYDSAGIAVIEDGKITITYSLLNLSYDLEKSFEKKGSSIYIDGTEFVKEK